MEISEEISRLGRKVAYLDRCPQAVRPTRLSGAFYKT
jgi:hypothetical protein